MEQEELIRQMTALTEAVATIQKEQQKQRQMLEEWMTEDAIGKAAERYAGKMAVLRGENL